MRFVSMPLFLLLQMQVLFGAFIAQHNATDEYLPTMAQSKAGPIPPSLSPTLISCHIKNQPAQQVLRELEKQTGYQIELGPKDEGSPRYDFKFENVTFWEVLDKVCKVIGAYPKFEPNGKITLSYSKTRAPHSNCHGPFRVAVSDPHQNQDGSLTLSVRTWLEPRFALLHVDDIRVTHAIDDQGNSLVTAPESEPGHLIIYDNNRMYESELPIWLKKRPKGARTLKHLKGTIPVRIEKEKKTTELSGILKASGKRITVGTETIEIEEVKLLKNRDYVVAVSIGNVSPNETFHIGTWNLMDAKGLRYEHRQPKFDRSIDDQRKVSLHFEFTPTHAEVGLPEKLVFSRTSSSIEYQVPFEFMNLKLP